MPLELPSDAFHLLELRSGLKKVTWSWTLVECEFLFDLLVWCWKRRQVSDTDSDTAGIFSKVITLVLGLSTMFWDICFSKFSSVPNRNLATANWLKFYFLLRILWEYYILSEYYISSTRAFIFYPCVCFYTECTFFAASNLLCMTMA